MRTIITAEDIEDLYQPQFWRIVGIVTAKEYIPAINHPVLAVELVTVTQKCYSLFATSWALNFNHYIMVHNTYELEFDIDQRPLVTNDGIIRSVYFRLLSAKKV